MTKKKFKCPVNYNLATSLTATDFHAVLKQEGFNETEVKNIMRIATIHGKNGQYVLYVMGNVLAVIEYFKQQPLYELQMVYWV